MYQVCEAETWEGSVRYEASTRVGDIGLGSGVEVCALVADEDGSERIDVALEGRSIGYVDGRLRGNRVWEIEDLAGTAIGRTHGLEATVLRPAGHYLAEMKGVSTMSATTVSKNAPLAILLGKAGFTARP